MPSDLELHTLSPLIPAPVDRKKNEAQQLTRGYSYEIAEFSKSRV